MKRILPLLLATVLAGGAAAQGAWPGNIHSPGHALHPENDTGLACDTHLNAGKFRLRAGLHA